MNVDEIETILVKEHGVSVRFARAAAWGQCVDRNYNPENLSIKEGMIVIGQVVARWDPELMGLRQDVKKPKSLLKKSLTA